MDELKIKLLRGEIDKSFYKEKGIFLTISHLGKFGYEYVGKLADGSRSVIVELKHLIFKLKPNVAGKIVLDDDISDGELTIWPNLSHDGILPLITFKTVNVATAKIFISPKCEMTLSDKLRQSSFSSDEKALDKAISWMKSVVFAFDYLHEKDLSYLNLKTEHVLITEDEKAKICGFEYLNPSQNPVTKVGSVAIFRPPEAFTLYDDMTHVDGKKFDVWTSGILTVEIFSGLSLSQRFTDEDAKGTDWDDLLYMPVFFDTLKKYVLEEILEEKFPRSTGISEKVQDIVDFAKACLVLSPESRPSIKEVLKQQLFADTHPEEIQQKNTADENICQPEKNDTNITADYQIQDGDPNENVLKRKAELPNEDNVGGSEIAEYTKYFKTNSDDFYKNDPEPIYEKQIINLKESLKKRREILSGKDNGTTEKFRNFLKNMNKEDNHPPPINEKFTNEKSPTKNDFDKLDLIKYKKPVSAKEDDDTTERFRNFLKKMNAENKAQDGINEKYTSEKPHNTYDYDKLDSMKYRKPSPRNQNGTSERLRKFLKKMNIEGYNNEEGANENHHSFNKRTDSIRRRSDAYEKSSENVKKIHQRQNIRERNEELLDPDASERRLQTPQECDGINMNLIKIEKDTRKKPWENMRKTYQNKDNFKQNEDGLDLDAIEKRLCDKKSILKKSKKDIHEKVSESTKNIHQNKSFSELNGELDLDEIERWLAIPQEGADKNTTPKKSKKDTYEKAPESCKKIYQIENFYDEKGELNLDELERYLEMPQEDSDRNTALKKSERDTHEKASERAKILHQNKNWYDEKGELNLDEVERYLETSEVSDINTTSKKNEKGTHEKASESVTKINENKNIYEQNEELDSVKNELLLEIYQEDVDKSKTLKKSKKATLEKPLETAKKVYHNVNFFDEKGELNLDEIEQYLEISDEVADINTTLKRSEKDAHEKASESIEKVHQNKNLYNEKGELNLDEDKRWLEIPQEGADKVTTLKKSEKDDTDEIELESVEKICKEENAYEQNGELGLVENEKCLEKPQEDADKRMTFKKSRKGTLEKSLRKPKKVYKNRKFHEQKNEEMLNVDERLLQAPQENIGKLDNSLKNETDSKNEKLLKNCKEIYQNENITEQKSDPPVLNATELSFQSPMKHFDENEKSIKQEKRVEQNVSETISISKVSPKTAALLNDGSCVNNECNLFNTKALNFDRNVSKHKNDTNDNKNCKAFLEISSPVNSTKGKLLKLSTSNVVKDDQHTSENTNAAALIKNESDERNVQLDRNNFIDEKKICWNFHKVKNAQEEIEKQNILSSHPSNDSETSNGKIILQRSNQQRNKKSSRKKDSKQRSSFMKNASSQADIFQRTIENALEGTHSVRNTFKDSGVQTAAVQNTTKEKCIQTLVVQNVMKDLKQSSSFMKNASSQTNIFQRTIENALEQTRPVRNMLRDSGVQTAAGQNAIKEKGIQTRRVRNSFKESGVQTAAGQNVIKEKSIQTFSVQNIMKDNSIQTVVSQNAINKKDKPRSAVQKAVKDKRTQSRHDLTIQRIRSFQEKIIENISELSKPVDASETLTQRRESDDAINTLSKVNSKKTKAVPPLTPFEVQAQMVRAKNHRIEPGEIPPWRLRWAAQGLSMNDDDEQLMNEIPTHSRRVTDNIPSRCTDERFGLQRSYKNQRRPSWWKKTKSRLTSIFMACCCRPRNFYEFE